MLPSPLKDTLDEIGMQISELGNTYQAVHVQGNGEVAESAIDTSYMKLI